MNALIFFTSVYGFLWNRKGMPVWLLTLPRKVLRRLANWYLPHYLSKNYKPSSVKNQDLIISLTSFPARINEVWKVIECLKRQTVLPERIILWLCNDEFPDLKTIPQTLYNLQDDLFEIKMVDQNFRSHNKYFFALKEYPNKTIITCDDDQYYAPDMVSRLLNGAEKYPGCIIANKTTQILFGKDGNVLPYLQWDDRVKLSDNYPDLLQLGVAGVLYPPHTLHKLVTDSDLFTKLSPLADDIWLNCMARLKGTPVKQSAPYVLLLPILIDSAPALMDINNGQGMNDVQIRQIREFLQSNGYKDVYSNP